MTTSGPKFFKECGVDFVVDRGNIFYYFWFNGTGIIIKLRFR